MIQLTFPKVALLSDLPDVLMFRLFAVDIRLFNICLKFLCRLHILIIVHRRKFGPLSFGSSKVFSIGLGPTGWPTHGLASFGDIVEKLLQFHWRRDCLLVKEFVLYSIMRQSAEPRLENSDSDPPSLMQNLWLVVTGHLFEKIILENLKYNWNDFWFTKFSSY